MILLLLFSAIDINIYSNKDTYLIGESIIVWWEIANTGDSVEYYQGSATIATSILMTEGEHLQFHDSTGREIPGDKISGIFVTKSKSGIPKVQMEEIKPGDTIKSSEEDLIGSLGALRFSEYGGFFNKYIRPGEYFLSFYVYGKSDRSEKIYSDTLHFLVKEPTGKEKEAWKLYKQFNAELNNAREKEMVEYGYELLTKYPESVYIEGLLVYLETAFRRWGRDAEMKERMAPTTRKIVDYLEKNFGKFQGKERALKETVNCITHGELMLGTPKEEVKQKILQMNVPVTSDIKEVLEIKPEDPDTTKKN